MAGPRARYFAPAEKTGDLQCTLCPRQCGIEPGNFGYCRVRGNRNGEGFIPHYGLITAAAMDPIEKKPLYHYRPGSLIFSLGFAGCNLRCPFCQNWHISQTVDVPGRRFTPEEILTLAREAGASQIAYTYSEPLVHIEFLLDCMEAVHEGGMANVLVSNGCIRAAGAEAVLALTDAANIDLKCFSGDTYTRLLGGNLPAVLDFIKTAFTMGVHTEVTTLIVPGLNDSEEEIAGCGDFLAGLSRDIPWHLSAYHPDYRWKAPATEASRLRESARRAKEVLSFVYTGNIPAEGREFTDTLCPACGAALIRRRGYRIDTRGLVLKKPPAPSGKAAPGACSCGHCGAAVSFIIP
jgi:pyruvate formate lyase activating enzyme